jgi:ankyrin repeat protein
VLIKNGCDLSVHCENDDRTAIHTAAQFGHDNVVKLLLKSDINTVNQEDDEGWTALFYASSKNVAEALIKTGACDLNRVDKEGLSALHWSVENRNFEVSRCLIQNGACLDDLSPGTKATLFFSAAANGCVDIVTLMIEKGMDLNTRSSQGRTALAVAASRYKHGVTLQLICFGALIDDTSLANDRTGLLKPINDNLVSLRDGNGMKETLLSDLERKFMWNLAFCFTIKHRAAAFKAYYAIRSFITFNGIFMAPGFSLGKDSAWVKNDNEEIDAYREELRFSREMGANCVIS